MKNNFLFYLIIFFILSEPLKANDCLIRYQQKKLTSRQKNLELALHHQFVKNPNSSKLLLVSNTLDTYLSEIYKTHQSLVDTIEAYGSENHLLSAQSLWQHSIESIKNYTSFSSTEKELTSLEVLKNLNRDKTLEKCLKNSEHCKTILSLGVNHYENLLQKAQQLKDEISFATQQASNINQNSLFFNSISDVVEKKLIENLISSKITYLEQLNQQMDSIEKLILNKINIAKDEFNQINDLLDFFKDSNDPNSKSIEFLNKQTQSNLNVKLRTPEGIFIAGYISKYYDGNFHDLFFEKFFNTFNRHFNGVLSQLSIADFIEINTLLAEKEIYFSGDKLAVTQTKMIKLANGGNSISISFPNELHPLIARHLIVEASKKLHNWMPTKAVAKLDLILSNFFLLLPAVKLELHSNEKAYDLLFSILSEFIKTELSKKSLKEKYILPPDEVIVGNFILKQIDLMRARFKLDLLVNQRNLLRGKNSRLIPVPFAGNAFEYILPFKKSSVRVISKVFTDLSNERLQNLLFNGPKFKTIPFSELIMTADNPKARKKQLQSSFDSNTEFVFLTDVPHSFFMFSENKDSLVTFPEFKVKFDIELYSIRSPYIDNARTGGLTYDIILSRNKKFLKDNYNLEYIDFHR